MPTPGEFRISPQSLQTASQQTQRCADDLRAATETLRSKILGAGSPWGADEMGTVFATAYTECTHLGLDVLSDLSQHIADMGSSLAQMAQNIQAADEANAAGFDQIDHP